MHPAGRHYKESCRKCARTFYWCGKTKKNMFTNCNSILHFAALSIQCTRLGAQIVFHRHSLSAQGIDPSSGLHALFRLSSFFDAKNSKNFSLHDLYYNKGQIIFFPIVLQNARHCWKSMHKTTMCSHFPISSM